MLNFFLYLLLPSAGWPWWKWPSWSSRTSWSPWTCRKQWCPWKSWWKRISGKTKTNSQLLIYVPFLLKIEKSISCSNRSGSLEDWYYNYLYLFLPSFLGIEGHFIKISRGKTSQFILQITMYTVNSKFTCLRCQKAHRPTRPLVFIPYNVHSV